MPYAPGVQDISGQLLAQGMQQRAQGFAGGFTQFIAGMEQNKRMTNDALAKFQGAMAANKDLLPFLESANDEENPNAPRINPEIVKAFSEVRQGKTDVWNTALLANFAETYNKAAMESKMMAYRQAETDRLAATTAFEKLKTSQLQAEMDADKAWRERQPQGAPGAGPTQPAPQQGMAAPLTFLQGLSQQVPSYGGGGGASQGVPPSLARFAGPMAQTAAPQAVAASADTGEVPAAPQPDSAQEQQDPFIIKAATLLGRSPQNRSALPQIRQYAQNLRQEAEKQAALTRRAAQLFPTQEAALLDAKSKKERGLVPAGQELQVKYDRNAGGWFTESGTGLESPEASATREEAKKRGELKATEESDYLKKIELEGMAAMDSRNENQEIRRLLKSGIRTGPIQQIKNEYRKVAAAFDLADPETIQTAQGVDALDALMVQNQLRTVKEFTRGAQNAMEQKLGARAVANFDNKLPGANAYLNDMAEAIKAKKEDHYRERIRLEETMDDRAKVARELKKWDMNPQNRVSAYLDRIRQGEPAPSASANAPKFDDSGRRIITSTAEYDALKVGTPYVDSKGNLGIKRQK